MGILKKKSFHFTESNKNTMLFYAFLIFCCDFLPVDLKVVICKAILHLGLSVCPSVRPNVHNRIVTSITKLQKFKVLYFHGCFHSCYWCSI